MAQSKEPEKHSTEFTSLHTQFGVRRQSIRRTGPEKKPTHNDNVDSELQRHFAKRHLKNSDPNSLIVLEKKIHETKLNVRASVKQKENKRCAEIKEQKSEILLFS